MKKVPAIVWGVMFLFLVPVMETKASDLLFANDAAITDLGGFHDTECQSEFDAWIVLFNAGTTDLLSADILVFMNGTNSYSYSWSGLLTPGSETVVQVGICTVLETENIMEAAVQNPNGVSDENSSNDSRMENFWGMPYSGMGMTINLTTDLWPEETSWVILQNGVELFSSSFYPATVELSTFNYSFCLPPGCFEFIIYDSFGDGICCNYGEGSYEIWDDLGNLVIAGGTFGTEESTILCNEVLSTENLELEEVKLFPNPSDGMVTLEIPGSEINDIRIYDLSGKLVYENKLLPGVHTLELDDLSSGMYQVTCVSSTNLSTVLLRINQ